MKMISVKARILFKAIALESVVKSELHETGKVLAGQHAWSHRVRKLVDRNSPAEKAGATHFSLIAMNLEVLKLYQVDKKSEVDQRFIGWVIKDLTRYMPNGYSVMHDLQVAGHFVTSKNMLSTFSVCTLEEWKQAVGVIKFYCGLVYTVALSKSTN